MKISQSELLVMQAIWDLEPCTSEEIIKKLNQKQEWHEKTVKTLLNRLLKKQALSHQRDGRQYLYSSNIAKNEYQKNESKNFVGQMFNGKLSGLVASFAQEDALQKEDVEALKKLIASWEQKND